MNFKEAKYTILWYYIPYSTNTVVIPDISACMLARRYQKGQLTTLNRRRTDNTMAKRKGTNNDLQNTTQKTKDRTGRTPLKPGDELRRSEWVSNSCSTMNTYYATLVTNPVLRHK